MSYSNTLVFMTPTSGTLVPTSTGASNDWRRSYHVDKRRRGTFTRYVKSWTVEEEAFLLRQRLQKMPYKHIAIHLRKTELACRLHYHQMTSAKPRCDAATSNAASSSSLNTDAFSESAVAAVDRDASICHSGILLSPNGARDDTKISDDVSSSSPLPVRLMTLNLRAPQGQEVAMEKRSTTEKVDLGRLCHVYADHREDIWAFIAEKYSTKTKVSPSELETAFFTTKTVSLDTEACSLSLPSNSPKLSIVEPNGQSRPSSSAGGTQGPRPKRCTVSAMLNTTDELSNMERGVNCFRDRRSLDYPIY